MRKHIRAVALAVVSVALGAGLGSCREDVFDSPPSDNGWADEHFFIIEGSQSSAPATRVGYVDDVTSVFDEGDVVGAFAFTDEEGSATEGTENVPMKVVRKYNASTGESVQTLQAADPSLYISKTAPRYLFYYPYDPALTFDRLREYSYTVKTDQSANGDTDNYEVSDFIWDFVRPDAGAKRVRITFEHLMANIVVIIPRDKVAGIAGITVAAQPVSVSKANLLTENVAAMNYTPGPAQGSDVSQTTFGESTHPRPDQHVGVPAYARVAIPACRMLVKTGDVFLRVTFANGSHKEYRYGGAPLDLRPGHNYYFAIEGRPPTVPDVGDEDSWVLEVRDPEGELVGLLCREYLYYVDPSLEGASNYRDAPNDAPEYKFEKYHGNLVHPKNPGTMVRTNPGAAHDDAFMKQIEELRLLYGKGPGLQASGTLGVNSQAWVFYNLKPGSSDMPDLTRGTVLRFIWDLVGGGNHPGYSPIRHPKYAYNNWGQYQGEVTQAIWPLPHKGKLNGADQQGLFKTRHGHERILDGSTGLVSGIDSDENLEYYMHGGEVIWDAGRNIIDRFIMPDDMITNSRAFNDGHIAVKVENGRKVAFVSYTPVLSDVQDADGNAVCHLIPKTLTSGDKTYPLRKIGFNQFWTAKSLSSTRAVTGEKLVDYDVTRAEYRALNGGSDEGYRVGMTSFQPYQHKDRAPEKWQKYGARVKLEPGYIMPTVRKGENVFRDDNTFEDDFDPVNETYPFQPAFLYNLATIHQDKLVPAATATEQYRVPTWRDVTRLQRYGGYLFSAKWISEDTQLRHDGTYMESHIDALRQGKMLRAGSYCANISGLDLFGHGVKFATSSDDDPQECLGLGRAACFYVDTRDPEDYVVLKTRDDYERYLKYRENWIDFFFLTTWSVWGSNPLSDYSAVYHGLVIQKTETGDDMPIVHSRFFAPVRLMMQFRDPVGPGASQSRMRTLLPASARIAPRNIPLSLESMN